MFDAIVFDMDGVIFDTEKVSKITWLYAGKIMDIFDIENSYLDCIGLNRFDRGEYFYKKYGKAFDYERFMTIVKTKFNDILDNGGLVFKEGAKELIEYLNENAYLIALATSTNKDSTYHHLKKYNLENSFKYIITGDTVTHSKPAPDIYLSACEKLNVLPENTLAIEDSFNGVNSAYNANMKVIMVPDMRNPTDDIEKKLYKKYDNLTLLLKDLKADKI